MNKDNLLKLADHLESDELGMEFDMSSYCIQAHKIQRAGDPPFLQPKDHNCGTVACALGHGLAAGIAPTSSEALLSWGAYLKEAFDVTEEEYIWCFDSGWSFIDNTPIGAAKRIRHLVKHGRPPEWFSLEHLTSARFPKSITSVETTQ